MWEIKMRTFEQMNDSNGETCPICGKGNDVKDKEVVLIGVYGTQEGNIIEAKQFHLACLELTYYADQDIIAQRIR